VSTPGIEKIVMVAHNSVIDELEEAIASKEIGRRTDTLRRVTDLFVSGCSGFSGDQIALFDDVMNLLAREIESAARALRPAAGPDRERAAANHARLGAR